jgi:hypothetical protein
MALEAEGRHGEARLRLAMAHRLQAGTAPRTGTDPGPPWWSSLLNEILALEAECVIVYDPVFPARPFTR